MFLQEILSVSAVLKESSHQHSPARQDLYLTQILDPSEEDLLCRSSLSWVIKLAKTTPKWHFYTILQYFPSIVVTANSICFFSDLKFSSSEESPDSRFSVLWKLITFYLKSLIEI